MRGIGALCVAVALLGTLLPASAMRAGFTACKDRAAMARAIELSDEADYQAARRLIEQGLKSRDCQFIPAGELVIEATPPFSRLVKVHRRGDPDLYWIIYN